MCCHGGPGNILISLNTHESSSLPLPPAYPGFSNGQRRHFVDSPPDAIVVGTPTIFFVGNFGKCMEAFPHLAAVITTTPTQWFNRIVDDSTFSYTDILASIALETFDSSGTASGAFSVCEAGYAMVPLAAEAPFTVTASSRTIFSFP